MQAYMYKPKAISPHYNATDGRQCMESKSSLETELLYEQD